MANVIKQDFLRVILVGLWFSGGFEYNCLSSFESIQKLHENVDVWQRSMLLGISKKYKSRKKEGNMQLLYDFCITSQPRQQRR